MSKAIGVVTIRVRQYDMVDIILSCIVLFKVFLDSLSHVEETTIYDVNVRVTVPRISNCNCVSAFCGFDCKEVDFNIVSS